MNTRPDRAGEPQVASFGAQLKQEREQRGVTLDDISLSTKIGTRMLRALEEEHFDQLPGGIFNKGFIRAYARTLGMDEEQVIADYLAATGAVAPTQKPENVVNNMHDQVPGPEFRAQLDLRTRDENRSASSPPWGGLAVALIVIVLGFAGWSFFSRQLHKTTSHPDVAQSNPPNLSSAGVANQPASPQSPPQSKLIASTNSVATARKPTATGVSATANEASPPSATARAAAAIGKQSQPAIPLSGRFLVSIQARQDSWISITVDGEVTTRHTLAASAQKTIAAHQELVVR